MIEIDGKPLVVGHVSDLIGDGKLSPEGSITWSGPSAYVLNWKGRQYEVEKLMAVVDAAIDLEKTYYDADANEWHDKLTKALRDLDK